MDTQTLGKLLGDLNRALADQGFASVSSSLDYILATLRIKTESTTSLAASGADQVLQVPRYQLWILRGFAISRSDGDRNMNYVHILDENGAGGMFLDLVVGSQVSGATTPLVTRGMGSLFIPMVEGWRFEVVMATGGATDSIWSARALVSVLTLPTATG